MSHNSLSEQVLYLVMENDTMPQYLTWSELQRLFMVNQNFYTLSSIVWRRCLHRVLNVHEPFVPLAKSRGEHLEFMMNYKEEFIPVCFSESSYFLGKGGHLLCEMRNLLWKFIKRTFSWKRYRECPLYFYFKNDGGRLCRIIDIFYYEVTVVSVPEEPWIYCLSIGLSTKDHFHYLEKNKLPVGWTDQSIAYHSDDGIICWDGHSTNPKHEPFGEGDTIGCGFDLSRNLFFFTKNGLVVNVYSFRWNPWLGQIFPAIGMDGFFKISANLGDKPFLFPLSPGAIPDSNFGN